MPLFFDTFDGTADSLITTRPGWSTGDATTNYARLNGAGGVKSIDVAGNTTSGVCHYDTGSADHFAQVTLGNEFAKGGTSWDTVFVRGRVNGYAHYSVTYTSSNTLLRLRQYGSNTVYNANTVVDLASRTMTLVAGDVIRLEALGDTLRVLVNGVEQITTTNSALSGNTRTGFRARSSTTQNPFILDFASNVLSTQPAPVLTTPTGAATSSRTAVGSVRTNGQPGVLRYMASVNATETATTLFGAGSEIEVSNDDTYTVEVTGLLPSTTYRLHFCQEDEYSVRSAVVSSAQFTTPSADTVPPTLSGAITVVSKTSSTINATCPAGTDNVGVVAYDWSRDGGVTWSSQTQLPAHTFTDLTPLTSYNLRVRARDGDGNTSTPLSLTTSTYREGALGSTILLTTGPIDGNPAGILYNDVDSGDEGEWFSFVITQPPATGTLVIDPDGTFTFTGPNAETMYYQLEVNGVNVGAPVLVTLYSGTFYRPSSDVVTTGWTSTGTTLAGAINELSPNDATFITSPDVSGTPGAYTADVPPIPAGNYMRRLRARRTGATGEIRLLYLDAGGAEVGVTPWQALTSTMTTYSVGVTLTGIAVRLRIEVRG